MMAVCPEMMMPMPMPLTRSAKDRMSHEGEGCQCVPDFLLAMVPGMPAPGTPVAGRSATNRAAVEETSQQVLDQDQDQLGPPLGQEVDLLPHCLLLDQDQVVGQCQCQDVSVLV